MSSGLGGGVGLLRRGCSVVDLREYHFGKEAALFLPVLGYPEGPHIQPSGNWGP